VKYVHCIWKLSNTYRYTTSGRHMPYVY